AARVDAVDAGRQLTVEGAGLRRRADARVDAPGLVETSARGVDLSLEQLAAVRRIREPDAPVRVRDDVVRGIEVLAVVLVGDDADGPVVLVAHDAPRQVLARNLPSLVVERVAVAVVRR